MHNQSAIWQTGYLLFSYYFVKARIRNNSLHLIWIALAIKKKILIIPNFNVNDSFLPFISRTFAALFEKIKLNNFQKLNPTPTCRSRAGFDFAEFWNNDSSCRILRIEKIIKGFCFWIIHNLCFQFRVSAYSMVSASFLMK